jgi:hypothetical protein
VTFVFCKIASSVSYFGVHSKVIKQWSPAVNSSTLIDVIFHLPLIGLPSSSLIVGHSGAGYLEILDSPIA